MCLSNSQSDVVYGFAVLTLNPNSKFTVGCSRVLIEVLVVGYHTAFMFTAHATTVNLPVSSG
jgi:hypothetical protein